MGGYGDDFSYHAWVLGSSSLLSGAKRFLMVVAEARGLGLELTGRGSAICCQVVRSSPQSVMRSVVCVAKCCLIACGTLLHPMFCPFLNLTLVS